ncbi:MAG: PorT family protein [Prevotella sp.]|jgi:opacity protein-like surface antigen|nr:PorT family protein [Prevotella sp.]
MKKNQFLPFALFLLISMLTVNTVSAQFRFGVRGGVDVASSHLNTGILKSDNRLGFQIGPTVEFTVPGVGFGFDVSALYGYKKYKITDIEEDAALLNYNYVSIPVNLKQRFSLGLFGIFITGGAYGNVKVDKDETNSLNDVMDAYKYKNFILGVGAGAGVNLFKHLDIGLYFRGDLTKDYKEEKVNTGTLKNKKNQSWTVGATYFF